MNTDHRSRSQPGRFFVWSEDGGRWEVLVCVVVVVVWAMGGLWTMGSVSRGGLGLRVWDVGEAESCLHLLGCIYCIASHRDLVYFLAFYFIIFYIFILRLASYCSMK